MTSPMKATAWNTGWLFRHLDSQENFVPVTIPHDAMQAEPRTELSANGINGGWYEGRDYEYIRRFTPDKSLRSKTLMLEFEGVYHLAEVYLNGEKIAERPYGYTNFYADLTDRVRFDEENELRVIARNSDQPNSRWYSGAGIYRPVVLWTADKQQHIALNGVRIRTVSINPATVEVAVRTVGAGRVSVDVLAGEKQVASAAADTTGEVTLTLTVPNAKLWDVEHPNLYTCRVRFGSDEDLQTFGIRTLSWGKKGILLNGERVIVQGACIHHDQGILGARCYAQGEERRVRLLKENGYNAVRSAHNPCSKALLDACDRLGMLMMDEYIDHWYIHKTEYDYVPYFDKWWKQDIADMVDKDYNHPCVILYSTGNEVSETAQKKGIQLTRELTEYLHSLDNTRPVTCGINIFFNFLSSIGFGVYFDKWWKQDIADMVDKDYNHPCVILYSTGNEVSETAQKKGIQLTRELTEYLHSLDNTRPVTCGINIFFNFLSSIGFGVYSDEKAKKEAEKAEKLRAAGVQPQKKKAVGSKFFNDLAGLMGDEFMKRGATLHGCDVRTRDAFANMDIAGYNYGIYRYKHDLKKYPNRLILGSETFCNDAYRFREQAKKNPRLVGDFVWAGMDYLGEVGVGSWEYKAYATQFSGLGWTTAGSGRIDLNGRPLGEALYTRVALEQEIGPYIAVRPVMFSGEKHSPSAWKMTDAMPSWSWAGCEGKKAHIEVYARAAKVALLLNGKKVAEKQLKNDCLAKFTIPYQSGTLEAVSYDAIDRVLGRCKLQTAGADTVLRAVPEEKKTKPGRLCYIRIRYTDRAGELKPMERGMVNITVSGGKLLAAGSACPFHPGSYLTPETDTYYGEALAVVEAGESGAVEVSISDGERSDTVKIPIA